MNQCRFSPGPQRLWLFPNCWKWLWRWSSVIFIFFSFSFCRFPDIWLFLRWNPGNQPARVGPDQTFYFYHQHVLLRLTTVWWQQLWLHTDITNSTAFPNVLWVEKQNLTPPRGSDLWVDRPLSSWLPVCGRAAIKIPPFYWFYLSGIVNVTFRNEMSCL